MFGLEPMLTASPNKEINDQKHIQPYIYNQGGFNFVPNLLKLEEARKSYPSFYEIKFALAFDALTTLQKIFSKFYLQELTMWNDTFKIHNEQTIFSFILKGKEQGAK